jgi:hypothetical protein
VLLLLIVSMYMVVPVTMAVSVRTAAQKPSNVSLPATRSCLFLFENELAVLAYLEASSNLSIILNFA